MDEVKLKAMQIFYKNLNLPMVILNSCPRVSLARRLRLYITNIRGHASWKGVRFDEFAPPAPPNRPKTRTLPELLQRIRDDSDAAGSAATAALPNAGADGDAVGAAGAAGTGLRAGVDLRGGWAAGDDGLFRGDSRPPPLPPWVHQAWPAGYLSYVCTKTCQSYESIRRHIDECDRVYSAAVENGERDPKLGAKLLAEVRLMSYVPDPRTGKFSTMPIHVVEELMGYERGHVTAHGHTAMGEAQMRKALGDSYQVETVCYWLVALKKKQDEGKLPAEGLTVLSLFDGIGGLAVVGSASKVLSRPLKQESGESMDGTGRV